MATQVYKCFVCDVVVDINSSNVVRQAVVWLKGASKTVAEVIREDYRYCHSFCLSRKDAEETLF